MWQLVIYKEVPENFSPVAYVATRQFIAVGENTNRGKRPWQEVIHQPRQL